MAVLIVRAPREPPAIRTVKISSDNPKNWRPSARESTSTSGRTGLPVYTTRFALPNDLAASL